MSIFSKVAKGFSNAVGSVANVASGLTGVVSQLGIPGVSNIAGLASGVSGIAGKLLSGGSVNAALQAGLPQLATALPGGTIASKIASNMLPKLIGTGSKAAVVPASSYSATLQTAQKAASAAVLPEANFSTTVSNTASKLGAAAKAAFSGSLGGIKVSTESKTPVWLWPVVIVVAVVGVIISIFAFKRKR